MRRGLVCKPVVGHFEAQGNYQFIITGAVPSAAIGGVPTILFFTGKSTIFLESGDQLRTMRSGSG